MVVVPAAFTAWGSPVDALPAKFPSLAYVAVAVRAPTEPNVILQLPTVTLALQLSGPPVTVTVTVPVGVPLPGAFAVTVNVKLTACPTADGSGVSPVIAVVVAAGFTVWVTGVAVLLPAKLASPA